MKHRKLTWNLMVTFTIVTLLMLTGCSTATPEPEEPTATPQQEVEEPEPTPTEEAAEPEEPVEVVFWGSGAATWWDDFTAKFNEEHENITVKLEVFESEPYKTKLASAVLAGTEPCLYFTIPGPVSDSWIEQGEVSVLDDLVDADQIVPSARVECSSSDGNLVCVPMYISPGFMYYNVDMFEEAVSIPRHGLIRCSRPWTSSSPPAKRSRQRGTCRWPWAMPTTGRACFTTGRLTTGTAACKRCGTPSMARPRLRTRAL